MSEFVQLAYEELGLDMKGHDIGTMRYIDLPETVLHALCVRHLNIVNQHLYAERPRSAILTDDFLQADHEWCGDVRINCFLLYKEWLHILKNIKSYDPAGWRDTTLLYDKRWKAVVECHFKYDLYAGGKYEPTLAGWKTYLREASPAFHKFLQNEIPVQVNDNTFLHAYIVAGSRSGKTELLKLMAHSILNDRNTALVFLEPAGEASQEIAWWKENVNTDRLVYVEHSLKLGKTPVINPFEISGIDPSDTSLYALGVKRVVALQLAEALHEIVSQGQGAEITGNMDTVLTQCILVLLDYPGATFTHLMHFMENSERGSELIAFARSRTHYGGVADYFATDFVKDKGLEETKRAIRRKLRRLFLTGIFEHLTCGKSTIDLEKELEQRKIIVFNLSKGAVAGEGSAFGRLITALLLGIAFRRAAPGSKKEPIPIRYIMDECHNYLTKSVSTIVTEVAKFQLLITMAQQYRGQEMGHEMQNAISGAGVRIGGRNTDDHHRSTATMLGADEQDIAALKRGDFIIRLPEAPPFKFRTRTNLLEKANSMSDGEWERVKADQLERYYRPISQPVTEIVPPRLEPVQEIVPPVKKRSQRQVQGLAASKVTEEEEDVI
jgi:hypothetical protein